MKGRAKMEGREESTETKAAKAASLAVAFASALSAIGIVAVLGACAGDVLDQLGKLPGSLAAAAAAAAVAGAAAALTWRAGERPGRPRKVVGDARAFASILLFFLSFTAFDVLSWAFFSKGSLLVAALWLVVWTYQCATQVCAAIVLCSAARREASNS